MSRSAARRALLIAVLLVLTYGVGALSHERRWFPTPQIERLIRRSLWRVRSTRGFRDTTGRTEVSCDLFRQPGTAVLLTLGQSNAANQGETPHHPGAGVFNFNPFDSKCYVANDPLLGTTGTAGSVWTRLGDKLVATGRFARVLIVPIAVGASEIREWVAGGVHHGRIAAAAQALQRQGLHVTHVLWHQGESDARSTTQADYVTAFRSVLGGIRAAGIDAPVYVAVASICENQGSDAIRAAQREIAASFDNVLPGPNTDTLDRFVWRFDLCHFSDAGLEQHAQLWLEALH